MLKKKKKRLKPLPKTLKESYHYIKETKYSYNTVRFNSAITTQERQCGIPVYVSMKAPAQYSALIIKAKTQKLGIIKTDLENKTKDMIIYF